jgi:hypothetical protein
MNESGREMPNHIATKAENVPNGIAWLERLDQTKKLSKKTTPRTKPGTRTAVYA